MAYLLSPIGNGFQFFTTTGLPLNGGYIYTYQAGSTTPLAPIFKARQERQLAEAAEAARQQRLQKTLSRSAGINPKD